MSGSRKRNREKHLAYKRAEYRSEAPGFHREEGRFVSRANALYDPRRDGPHHHADPAAAIMGDPPIGWHDRFKDAERRPSRAISLPGTSR